MVALKGKLPGAYAIELFPSRRNSKTFKVGLSLRSAYNRIRRLHPKFLPALSDDFPCTLMVAGVNINGRPYEEGCVCEYLPYVPRRGNAAGIGGRDGASKSFALGMVHAFYVFAFSAADVETSPENQVILVDMSNLPIIDTARSLYVLRQPENFVHHGLQNMTKRASAVDQALMHIDCITNKVHLVPHFSLADHVCGVRMWEAR